MSTVQDLYSFIQYRRDIQVTADDLIHIVNAAIRTIAKRLYTRGSSLCVGRMEVPIAAAQSYTASMAFTASSTGVAGTITDAAAQFIVEEFAAGMPITTTHATNPGPFKITTVAAGTLTLVTTDTVVAANASSITITSDASYGLLPDDFWGMSDKPYLSGQTYPISPLPSLDTELAYASAGTPQYYQILGNKIYVVPVTDASYTVKAAYFQRPTAVTVSTSTLPYRELFDDLIAEYVMMYFRGKEGNDSGALVIMDKMLKEGVDLIVSQYDGTAPAQFAQAIQWD